MNLILRLLSPLLLGLVRRFGARLSGLDPAQIRRAKRRLVSAVLLAGLGLTLVMTGVILTIVDLAVQYEQHGDFTWNAVLWICVGFLVSGVASAAGAKLVMPRVRDFVPFGRRATGRTRSAVATSGKAVRPPRRPEYAH